jgi:hypothetical protein
MPRSKPTRKLHVFGDDAGVQITILDQTLEPVRSGIQELEVELPPGLYEARFEAGSSVREQLISLDPDEETLVVHQERMPFASAAPLIDTRGEIAGQGKAAARLSKRKHRELGRGGQLFVFVRDEDLRARSNPARGLTLHDPDGKQVGEVESDGESGGGSAAQPPWAGCNYLLRSGSWRLRCRVQGFGLLEQSVVVSSQWQTQVFLQRRPLATGGHRWPDLADASVLMAETRNGFKPGLAETRATELARQALRDRRIAVPHSDIQAMVYKKKKNPMLAIYGAHLMIQSKDLDRGFLRSVVTRLRELIGDHPDVMALMLWLDPEAEVGCFAEPPMLYSSWLIVVAATAKRPELVPRGSLSALISENVLAGGPWLRWRVAPGMPRPEASETRGAKVGLGKAIAGVADALPEDPAVLWDEGEHATLAESEVVSFATLNRQAASAASDADVVERLGVPRTVAEDAISSVMERLDE